VEAGERLVAWAWWPPHSGSERGAAWARDSERGGSAAGGRGCRGSSGDLEESSWRKRAEELCGWRPKTAGRAEAEPAAVGVRLRASASEEGDGDGCKRKRTVNRYNGRLWYYAIWWEGKTVQKKALTTFWQKP
jgi:hypothetical protein